MRNGTVVDAPAAGDGLHVVLRHVLGDANCPKDALAVVCTPQLSSRALHESSAKAPWRQGSGVGSVSSEKSDGENGIRAHHRHCTI